MGEAFIMSTVPNTIDFNNPILDLVCEDPDSQSKWEQYGFMWRQYTTFKFLPWFVEKYSGRPVYVILNWDNWNNNSFCGYLFYSEFGPASNLTLGFCSGESSNDATWGSINGPSLNLSKYTYNGTSYDVYDTGALSSYRMSWSPLKLTVL